MQWITVFVLLWFCVVASASESPVAAIGNRTYPTLESAFNAARDGDTVTLLRDINVKTRGMDGRIKCYADGISLTLDGNGHTVSGLSDTTLVVYRRGTGILYLTVRDLTVKNSVNDAKQGGTALQVNPSVQVTLRNTKLIAGANRYAAVVVQQDGHLTVTDGSEISVPAGCGVLLNGSRSRLTVDHAAIHVDTVLYARADETAAEFGEDILFRVQSGVFADRHDGYTDLYVSADAPVSSVCFTDDGSGLRLDTVLSDRLVAWVEAEKDPGTKVFYGLETVASEICRYEADAVTVQPDGSVAFSVLLSDFSAAEYDVDLTARGYVSFLKNGETVSVCTEATVTSPRLASFGQLATETDPVRMLTLLHYINGVQNPVPVRDTAEPLKSETLAILPNTDTVFRTVGRTYERDGGLACDFSCTGIEFTAYCEGDIRLGIKTASFAYLTVYVDGVRVEDRIAAKSDRTEVCAVSGLERGSHTVMIVNQSQFNMATVILNSVTVQGSFTEKPKDRDLFFEFYGDSVLCGSNVYLGGTNVRTSDSTYGFGWIASQRLDADCNIIGHGGMGLVKSTHSYRMLDVYKLRGSILLNDTPQYDFVRIPDAVIVELGCNDYMNGKLSKTPEVYASGLRQFIGELRTLYGADVPIVWIYGYRDDEKDFWETTAATLSALRDAGDVQLYECCVSVAYIPVSDGGDGWHPNVETSLRMGEEVAEYLKILLGRKEDADYENSERLGFRNR